MLPLSGKATCLRPRVAREGQWRRSHANRLCKHTRGLCEIGFVHAVGIAAHSGQAELVRMHVTRGRSHQNLHPQPDELLRSWGMGSVSVKHRLYEASGQDEIADDLIAACATVKPDLLVMATHARSGLARVFGGSIAEAVARNVTIPCLLVPFDAGSFIDRRSGALALDRVLILGGSQNDAQLGVDVTAWFVRALGAHAELRLLHIDDGTPPPTVEVPVDLSLKWGVRRGSLEEAVLSVKYECHPSLVVMVTHGHDQLRDVLWSSRTERVLHHVKSPLLWIPPNPAASFKWNGVVAASR